VSTKVLILIVFLFHVLQKVLVVCQVEVVLIYEKQAKPRVLILAAYFNWEGFVLTSRVEVPVA
jgi:hypothetical protein